ncbi:MULTISPECIES: hypothetical protein [unclassified Sphingobium]|uniref:hypothetical protein n=1 Tax=unclassified Sphingobium TaxID=2611147 RepID=UPI0035A5E929
MTRPARRSRPHRRAAPTIAGDHLPHSSWTRRAEAKAPANSITPDDFWAKLGL